MSPSAVFSHASSGTDVGLLALFRRAPSSANVAKERLRIVVSQQRGARGGLDYLPLLRRELLEVIHKYVNVDPSSVQIQIGREDGREVLELSVALPEGRGN
jgi:cell division topological specificity factor